MRMRAEPSVLPTAGYIALQGRIGRNRNALSLATAFGACALAAAIGYMTADDPLFAVAVFGGAGAMLFSFLAPAPICLMLVAMSAVSVQYAFPDATLLGFDLQALQKLALLAFLVPALLRYGVAWFRLLPVAALSAAFLMTWIWGDPVDALSSGDSLKALLGLTAPLLLMAVRWPEREAGRLLHLVLVLPIISIAVGIVFQATGIQPVVMKEFTGAPRLQGANIPAHLAFLAFTALMASILLWKKRPHGNAFLLGMMAVHFLILLLTGTRGPLLASMPLVLLFLADMARQFFKGRSGLVVPLAGIAIVLGTSVLWQLDNLLKRSFTRSSSAGIDLSGREEAWRYFLERAAEAPWLGNGLGSVLLANDGTLYAGFVVPHNEYIRFYHDCGIIGAALLFASMLAVLGKAAGNMAAGMKWYWSAMTAGFLLYSVSDNTLSTLQFMVPFCVLVGAFGAFGGTDRASAAQSAPAGQSEPRLREGVHAAAIPSPDPSPANRHPGNSGQQITGPPGPGRTGAVHE
jgi:O-antigen ligase